MAPKTKLKLKVSARDNRRYFLVESLDRKKIEEAVKDYIGILGMAKASFVFISSDKNLTIASCVRESLNEVLAGIGFAGLKVSKVSGTIKGLNV